MMRLDGGQVLRLNLISSTINEDFSYVHTWLNMKKMIHSHSYWNIIIMGEFPPE